MSSIEVYNVRKNYKKVNLLENVEFKINENKIYILIGKEKTLIFELLNNRISPSTGGILFDNEFIHEKESIIENFYYCSKNTLYPENMKCKNVFKWTKKFYEDFDMDYAVKLSEQFNLNINGKVENLALEEEKILKIIVTLSSNANILIFDDPIEDLNEENQEIFFKELFHTYNTKNNMIILGMKEFNGDLDNFKYINVVHINKGSNEEGEENRNEEIINNK